MGAGGIIELSNLKTATGIADDRLSAHHPNGAGNTTGFADFFIFKIGREVGSTRYAQNSIVGQNGQLGYGSALSVPNQNVNGNSGLTFTSSAGSLNSNGDFVIDTDQFDLGDIFWIRVDLTANDFAREQIAKDQISVQSTVGTKILDRVGGVDDGHDVVDFKVEVTGLDSINVTLNFTDDYNTDSVLYNTDLVFFSGDVRKSDVYIDSITARWSDEGGNSNLTDCAGNPLDSISSAGDDNYAIRANVTVNDPVQKFGDLYQWVYFDDATKSPPDTPDDPTGPDQIPSAGNTGCSDFQEFLVSGNDYNLYCFITKDSGGTEVVDEEVITITPTTGNSNTTTNSSYDEQNQL